MLKMQHLLHLQLAKLGVALVLWSNWLKKLNLTDEQKTKVAAILKDQMTQMLELRKNEDLSQDDRRTQMMAIRKEGNAKIRALLTSEQQTTFDKLPPMGGGPRGKKKSDEEAPAPAAPPTT